jgi:hypothetical protein
MAYALIIKDKDGDTIVEHVSKYSDDAVYISDWSVHGYPQSEYGKASYLIAWVKENKPDWVIFEKTFEIEGIFRYIQ